MVFGAALEALGIGDLELEAGLEGKPSALLEQADRLGEKGRPALLEGTIDQPQDDLAVEFFIRRKDQLDYLEEPDIFHDLFGHIPLLTNPSYADYMHEYGKGGARALKYKTTKNLARLLLFGQLVIDLAKQFLE